MPNKRSKHLEKGFKSIKLRVGIKYYNIMEELKLEGKIGSYNSMINMAIAYYLNTVKKISKERLI